MWLGCCPALQAHNELFYQALEMAIGPTPSYDSSVGRAFEPQRIKDGFGVYAVYCTNHTQAMEELEIVRQDHDVALSLEACRLLMIGTRSRAGTANQGSSGISLEASLLTPIQRICRYPLLLQELLKITPAGHPDRAGVTQALETMLGVAAMINEDKRNAEQLPMIQDGIGSWVGPDLTETSSVLLHEGALHKISGGKVQERHFFLFDNLLLYCKRGVMGSLILKGRIPTDSLEVSSLEDGRHDGRGYKHGMKMVNRKKGKDYVVRVAGRCAHCVRCSQNCTYSTLQLSPPKKNTHARARARSLRAFRNDGPGVCKINQVEASLAKRLRRRARKGTAERLGGPRSSAARAKGGGHSRSARQVAQRSTQGRQVQVRGHLAGQLLPIVVEPSPVEAHCSGCAPIPSYRIHPMLVPHCL